MPLEINTKVAEQLPVEADGFTPDALRAAPLDEVRRFELQVGNTRVEAGELFSITGDPSGCDWRLEGDFSGVHHLGAGMREGAITVAGPVGRHAGAGMRDGRLSVEGSAGDWLGAEMRGGRIDVSGDAGDFVGAAYRGSMRGMRGGTIFVRGDAGDEVGHTMRRGWITVGGACGELVGYRMLAGSILVFGGCGKRAGAEMRRGTIGLFGDRPSLLPTFRPACRIAPQVLGVMNRELMGLGLEPPGEVELFNGDFLRGGRGEVLLRV